MIKTVLRTIAPLLFLMPLAGCATSSGATSHGMTFVYSDLDPVTAGEPFYQSITIGTVTGGEETHPLLGSNIATDELEQALQTSLIHRGIYSANNSAPLRLNAHLVDRVQHINGLEIWMTTKIRYELINPSGETMDEKIIEARYIDQMQDHWQGSLRQQDANEGSIRLNIRHYLHHLRYLELSRPDQR